MTERIIKVLIVEDNPSHVLLLREALARCRSEKMEVVTAGTLAEAEGLLKTVCFNAVLADLGLPDSQGHATFTKLKAAAPGLPIILLTVLDNEELALRLLKEGAQDYIVKGDPAPTLIAHAVTHAIERKTLSNEQERLIRELEEAAKNIRALSGLLTVCMCCKKVRDDKGSWRQMESYISDHSAVDFTHGICPECSKEHYSEAHKGDKPAAAR